MSSPYVPERVPHEAHVEVARVVGDDDGVAVVRDVRAAEDARLHELAVEDVLQLADERACPTSCTGSGRTMGALGGARAGPRATRAARGRGARAAPTSSSTSATVTHAWSALRVDRARSAPRAPRAARSSSSESKPRSPCSVASRRDLLDRDAADRGDRRRAPGCVARAVSAARSPPRAMRRGSPRTSSRFTLRVAVRGSGAS